MAGHGIGNDKIDLWWCRVPGEGADQSRAFQLLAADEKRRARRFKVDSPRRCLIAARFMLRHLVEGYTGNRPADIEFSYGDNGKPALLERDQAHPLHFNLSHSGSTVVAAFALGTEIGIDVEVIRPMASALSLAEKFFSDSETAFLASLEGDARERCFFHLWTCKEAYLKAIGTGMTTSLREVEINPDPGADPGIVAIGGDEAAARRWTLLRAEVGDGLMCTVAIEGTGWTLRAREFVGG